MLLRKDDPWPADVDMPDIRDWRVVDAQGHTVGFVQSIVVDQVAHAVEALLTGANDRFSGDIFEVRDGVVHLRGTIERRVSGGPRNIESGSRSFDAAFRDHYARSYNGEVYAYADVRPAYAFGRGLALDADFSGRPYVRAEEDIRAVYASQDLKMGFEEARAAIAHGYGLVQKRAEDR